MRKLALMLALGLTATSGDHVAAADKGVMSPQISERQYRVHTPRTIDRFNACRIAGACSLYGAYGLDGGRLFWGAYTGGGYYFR